MSRTHTNNHRHADTDATTRATEKNINNSTDVEYQLKQRPKTGTKTKFTSAKHSPGDCKHFKEKVSVVLSQRENYKHAETDSSTSCLLSSSSSVVCGHTATFSLDADMSQARSRTFCSKKEMRRTDESDEAPQQQQQSLVPVHRAQRAAQLVCPRRVCPSDRRGCGLTDTCAAEGHTAKKSRPQATKAPERNPKRTARKQLILPQESPQVPQPTHNEELKSASPAANCHDSVKQSSNPPKGGRSKVLSKEELSSLKTRLQGIKKRAEALSSSSSSSSASIPESSTSTLPSAKSLPPDSTSALPSTAGPVAQDQELKKTLARPKNLQQNLRRGKRSARQASLLNLRILTSLLFMCFLALVYNAVASDVLPAYQKYHTLAQAVPPGLSLPYQYKVLAEMFRCMDTVVAMLFNRSETPTFMKIKKGVQDMMHKRFEESHVGQIRTVFPEAYTLRQEKNIPTFNSSIKKGSYQLTVEPFIVSDEGELRPTLTATRLLERRRIFHHNLVSLVKQHHKAFLSSLDPPLTVPEDKLSRWHPRFNVDTVPAVPDSPLPSRLRQRV
ncbi:hypothetical protein WMY93_018229 [Mugilogobius chulae]|uniref:CDT1 Geminin-binding domain-containing protein n=1 Tax=Mugilogobius chulae TaxID=88201 RepID=A0AAW0NI94_9GOBI